MKLAKKWHKQVFAAVLSAAVVGAPLFAVHAEEQATFSRDGQRYDVRRGQFEKEGGSDTHVRLGQYADEQHQEARHEEQREDLEKRQAEERAEFEKRQAEERDEFEKQQVEEQQSEQREEVREEAKRGESQGEQREYRYDVRRGMYEKEGGSDTQVRRGMYEDESRPESERSSLTR